MKKIESIAGDVQERARASDQLGRYSAGCAVVDGRWIPYAQPWSGRVSWRRSSLCWECQKAKGWLYSAGMSSGADPRLCRLQGKFDRLARSVGRRGKEIKKNDVRYQQDAFSR
jgi:hypothetical protein